MQNAVFSSCGCDENVFLERMLLKKYFFNELLRAGNYLHDLLLKDELIQAV